MQLSRATFCLFGIDRMRILEVRIDLGNAREGPPRKKVRTRVKLVKNGKFRSSQPICDGNGERIAGRAFDPAGAALEHGDVPGLERQLRDHLVAGRPGTDHGHPLFGQVDVFGPARGVP